MPCGWTYSRSTPTHGMGMGGAAFTLRILRSTLSYGSSMRRWMEPESRPRRSDFHLPTWISCEVP